MSCGNPHETNCTEVLQAVYRFLDGEIDEENRHLILEHLDECAPCLRQFGIEQHVKALVARCCGDDHAPQDLRGKVVSRIHEVQLSIQHIEFRAD
jgi:mycothiol system anti-sigma-R factor